jgi:hypothetical protein
MRDTLIIFVILLVLLIMISVFGGSMRQMPATSSQRARMPWEPFEETPPVAGPQPNEEEDDDDATEGFTAAQKTGLMQKARQAMVEPFDQLEFAPAP